MPHNKIHLTSMLETLEKSNSFSHILSTMKNQIKVDVISPLEAGLIGIPGSCYIPAINNVFIVEKNPLRDLFALTEELRHAWQKTNVLDSTSVVYSMSDTIKSVLLIEADAKAFNYTVAEELDYATNSLVFTDTLKKEYGSLYSIEQPEEKNILEKQNIVFNGFFENKKVFDRYLSAGVEFYTMTPMRLKFSSDENKKKIVNRYHQSKQLYKKMNCEDLISKFIINDEAYIQTNNPFTGNCEKLLETVTGERRKEISITEKDIRKLMR